MTDMDSLLVAYADGELDEPAAHAVEAWLADNPEGQNTLAIHRETASLLRAAFSESLYARDAEALLPSTRPQPILSSQRAARLSMPSPARARPSMAPYGWALAASILMGVTGYGTGAFWPDLLISARDRMMTEVAEYHAVYSRETVHLVEVPAAQSDHLKMWLGKRVNRTLVIPDFKEAGLTFAGGRMVVLDGSPVAELMYTREKGLPIAFCVFYRKGKPDGIVMGQRGAMHLAAWDDGSHSYIVVGEADPATLRGLAVMAQKQL